MGLADSELSDVSFRSWGAALGRLIGPKARFAVTCDMRKHSSAFKAALIQGLCSEGIRVIDLETTPTDIASYACDTLGTEGYAGVTGGNRPPSWNGLTWRLKNSSLSLMEQVQYLNLETQNKMPGENDGPGKSLPPDSVRTYDVAQDWIAWLQTVWYDTPRVPLKVVVDSMYGNWSPLAWVAIQSVFPEMHVEAIRNEAKDNFGGIIPNSRIGKSITPLCNEIIRRKADLGIAFDNDANLFTIVDGNGIPLIPDEIAWFILHDLLSEALEDEFFLYDSNCSEKVVAEGLRLGGKPVLVAMDEMAFVHEMRQKEALIGIRSDGAIYFRGAYGNRIVVFAFCWFLDYLTQSGRSVAQWRTTAPSFFTTSEIRTPLAALDDVVQRLVAVWPFKPKKTVDGISFRLSKGRINIRKLLDYSQLGFYFEASDRQALFDLVRECSQCLGDLEHIGLFLNEQFQAEIANR